jgi:hypothetical protein
VDIEPEFVTADELTGHAVARPARTPAASRKEGTTGQ